MNSNAALKTREGIQRTSRGACRGPKNSKGSPRERADGGTSGERVRPWKEHESLILAQDERWRRA